jgi:hypothetical protein
VRRLGALTVVAAAVAAALASTATAALFFLFEPTSAKAGDLVTVRLGGTPPSFTTSQRQRPFQQGLRVYLVAAEDAAEIRGRFDPRLSFLGRIVPDARGRGLLRFTVPPLDTGDYVLAYWCPGCARHGSPTFGVQTIPRVARFRHLMGLRVELPDPREACPVTIPNATSAPPGLEPSARWHTNGFLWTGLPEDGVFSGGRVEPDGSIFEKWIWFAARVDGRFTVRLERLDAPGPTLEAETVRGSRTSFRGSATWAARMRFASPGCWRVTGRVGDVTLSYVIAVTRPA